MRFYFAPPSNNNSPLLIVSTRSCSLILLERGVTFSYRGCYRFLIAKSRAVKCEMRSGLDNGCGNKYDGALNFGRFELFSAELRS
jgi:hypothetical protein